MLGQVRIVGNQSLHFYAYNSDVDILTVGNLGVDKRTYYSALMFCSGRVTRSGEFSPYWAIVYFGQCFNNEMDGTHFLATCFHGTSYVLVLEKKLLGDVLGDFSQTRLVTLLACENVGVKLVQLATAGN
jgi:hypothetical protein